MVVGDSSTLVSFTHADARTSLVPALTMPAKVKESQTGEQWIYAVGTIRRSCSKSNSTTDYHRPPNDQSCSKGLDARQTGLDPEKGTQ